MTSFGVLSLKIPHQVTPIVRCCRMDDDKGVCTSLKRQSGGLLVKPLDVHCLITVVELFHYSSIFRF